MAKTDLEIAYDHFTHFINIIHMTTLSRGIAITAEDLNDELTKHGFFKITTPGSYYWFSHVRELSIGEPVISGTPLNVRIDYKYVFALTLTDHCGQRQYVWSHNDLVIGADTDADTDPHSAYNNAMNVVVP